MKSVVFSPAAIERFADIIEYTIEHFGVPQAERYTAQLTARLDALAKGSGPPARPCELLMSGLREAAGLTYSREGSHILILRETSDRLDVVDILHGRMDLERHLETLAKAIGTDDPDQIT